MDISEGQIKFGVRLNWFDFIGLTKLNLKPKRKDASICRS